MCFYAAEMGALGCFVTERYSGPATHYRGVDGLKKEETGRRPVSSNLRESPCGL